MGEKDLRIRTAGAAVASAYIRQVAEEFPNVKIRVSFANLPREQYDLMRLGYQEDFLARSSQWESERDLGGGIVMECASHWAPGTHLRVVS